MFGPSGFFQTFNDAEFPDQSIGLEVIYDSKAGFNILYRVNKNGRFFVYKALKPEFRGNVFYEDLLKKDFDIGFKLTHTAICQYYALIFLPEIGNCIVMEWIDGCSLEELLSKGAIPREKAKKLICEICDALDYMHKKQVVHRDLKPENILVTYNGSNIKIIDFGLSDTDSYSSYKAPAGTRIYASPELLAGEPTDGRSDIWSLGIIIREISGYYNRIANKCLKREKHKRFQSAAEVKRAVLYEGKRRIATMISCSTVTFIAIIGMATLIYANSNGREVQTIEERHTINGKNNSTPSHASSDSTSFYNSPYPELSVETKPADKIIVQPSEPNNIDAESLESLFDSAIKQL